MHALSKLHAKSSTGGHYIKYWGGGGMGEGENSGKFFKNLDPGNGICRILRTYFGKNFGFPKHCFNGAFC